MKKKTKILLGVSITLIIAIACYVVAGVIIMNYTENNPTYKADTIININKAIDIENGSTTENEYVAIDKEISQKEMIEYLENIKSQEKIKDYAYGNGGVMIEFLNGGKMYYNRYIPGYQSGGSTSNNELRNEVGQNTSIDNNKLSVLTAQPYANDSEMLSDVFDNSASLIANSELGYKFTDNIDDENVTIDFMKNLSKYRVIIFDGHGVYNPENNSFVGIALGEYRTKENIDKYSDDVNNGRLSWTGDYRYVVTPAFFEYYYKDNSFNDTLIYFGCCDVANDDSNLSEILIRKGAEAVLAYKKSVKVTYNRSMCETIFNELVKIDGETNSTKTVAEALETAKKQNGEKDPTNTAWYDFILHPIFQDYVKKADRAELILTENDDNSFRLIDENKKEDNKQDDNVDYEKLYTDYVNDNIISQIGVCKDFEKTLSNIPENEIYKSIENDKGLSSVYIEDFNNDKIPEMFTVSASGKDNNSKINPTPIGIEIHLYCVENNKVIDKGIVYETGKYDNADEQLYVYTVNNNDNKYLCLSDQFWYGGSSSGSIYGEYFKAFSVDNKNNSSAKADLTYSYNRGNVIYKINGSEYVIAQDGIPTDNSTSAESKLSKIFTNIGLNEFTGVNMESSNWMNFPQKATAIKIFECGTKYASDYEYTAYLKDYTDFSNKRNEVDTTVKETTTKLVETTSAKKETTTKEKTTESNLKNELLNYYWKNNIQSPHMYEFKDNNIVIEYDALPDEPKSNWSYCSQGTWSIKNNKLILNFSYDYGDYSFELQYLTLKENINWDWGLHLEEQLSDNEYFFYEVDFEPATNGPAGNAFYLQKSSKK
ncbi:MAG: hypothetical protein K2G70_03210 [Turicibacter sp.]|nr:hypothetical protein [Turicibacter sp.]